MAPGAGKPALGEVAWNASVTLPPFTAPLGLQPVALDPFRCGSEAAGVSGIICYQSLKHLTQEVRKKQQTNLPIDVFKSQVKQ